MSYLCEGLDVIVVLEAHHVAASLRVRRNFFFLPLFSRAPFFSFSISIIFSFLFSSSLPFTTSSHCDFRSPAYL